MSQRVDTHSMDPRLALLDRHVAQAADAWLADPRDAGVYGRLVTANEARRQYLHPTLDEAAPRPPVDDEEMTADVDQANVQVRWVGASLTGSPQAVLDRLRRDVADRGRTPGASHWA